MHEKAYIDLLEKLISIDTTSNRSNVPFIEFVEHYLQPFACTTERFPGETPEKLNLWVTFGPAGVPGYVLSGHSDTVPVEGQNWSRNPYKLFKDRGRVYGRGTADMKGFLAVCLAHAKQMSSAPLKRPIHLAISCDEELGCRGAPWLLSEISKREPLPLGCFVGEPTSMRVIAGHKGSQRYRMCVCGTTAHTSLAPFHVNAVENAAQVIEKIRTTSNALKQDGPWDNRFPIPYSVFLTTTVHGGRARNIVPDECVIEWECRLTPGDELANLSGKIIDYALNGVLPEMQKMQSETSIKFEQISETPSLDTREDHPIVELALTLMRKHTSQLERAGYVSFGTEAGLFNRAGIPSVVLGPGSIEQAHKVDEFVELTDLVKCGHFVLDLIRECCE